MIWGTDVSVSAYKTKFRKFLEQFVDSEAKEDEKIGAAPRLASSARSRCVLSDLADLWTNIASLRNI